MSIIFAFKLGKILFFLVGLVLFLLASVLILLVIPLPETPPPKTEEKRLTSPTPPASPRLKSLTTETEFSTKPLPPPLAAWEETLDSILTAPGDTSSAARELLAAIVGLPVEAQEQFISHALNLCEDTDFPLAEEIYLRPDTPPSVAEAIFNDALNRPDEVKLQLMAKTMNFPNHAMAADAREILEFYLELEPGAAPLGSWDIAVRDYIQNQKSL